MITHIDSPSDVRPRQERRRAARVRPGPLRVRLHRTCEGFLVDISETGALVQLPSSQASAKQITLQVEWPEGVMPLPGRVVRSRPQRLELATATLARSEYHVAVEFDDLPSDTRELLRHLVRRE